jgi:cell division protein FtsW
MNRSTDPWLIALVGFLTLLGMVMVYSASAVVAGESYGNEMHFFTRQGLGLTLGLGLCTCAALTPLRVLRRYRFAFYVAVLAGLVLCFVPGIAHRANGASRWIGFGPLHLQPSEFAKVAVLLVVADVLDRYRGSVSDVRVIVRVCALPIPALVLVLLEPDFGTTAIIAGLVGLMMFVAGIRLAHMAVAAVAGVVVGVPVMLFEEYRLKRLTSFIDPWASSEGDGYHVIQSWVAMHSGGPFGQGLGNSMAKLHFLPEPWTDFIAAVVAEELGLVGIVLLLAGYMGIVWRGLSIARRASDAFGMLMAASLTAMIGLQAFFNLAVVMGIVPPKGLVLPFVSYGVSALMAHLFSIGILLSIASETDTTPVTEGWGGSHRGAVPAASK